jgi:hypothetical protein
LMFITAVPSVPLSHSPTTNPNTQTL